MHNRTGMAVAAILLATGAQAQKINGMTPSEVADAWGEIRYCQQAYKHPTNAGRVYEFDTQQCNAAYQAIVELLEPHGEELMVAADRASQQRARMIAANTREIGAVVTACREACAKWAPEPEKTE